MSVRAERAPDAMGEPVEIESLERVLISFLSSTPQREHPIVHREGFWPRFDRLDRGQTLRASGRRSNHVRSVRARRRTSKAKLLCALRRIAARNQALIANNMTNFDAPSHGMARPDLCLSRRAAFQAWDHFSFPRIGAQHLKRPRNFPGLNGLRFRRKMTTIRLT